ncbi:hypothetical protein VV99743_03406 [Vibrio vulnificus]|nr:hypothetical protein VV99743_03406 [Vibrio vulnificus]
MVIRKTPLCIGICLLALVTANFLIGLLKGFSNGSRAYMNYDSFYFVGCSCFLLWAFHWQNIASREMVDWEGLENSFSNFTCAVCDGFALTKHLRVIPNAWHFSFYR